MSIVKFYEVKTETISNAHFLITKLVDKSKNCRFVAATLFDGETEKSVNLFNPNRSDPEGLTVSKLEQMGITEDSILETSICKNGEYYNASDWKANTDSSVTKADFVHMAPVNIEETYEWILNTVKSVDSNPSNVGPYKSLSYLAVQLLEKNKDAIKNSSAAVMMHHNFIGGLIYHTYRMLSLALKACDTYTNLDKELLICGTAIHDIGKICSLETSEVGTATITIEGLLLDHAVIGIEMVNDETKKNLYNPEKILMLKHMIASHHGRKEWDAIVTPSIPEAEMLHLIDMIDSRMNMFEEAYKGQECGSISDAKVFGLENSYIYLPNATV